VAECGTVAGFYAHYRRKEKPCAGCRAAANKAQRDRYARLHGKPAAGSNGRIVTSRALIDATLSGTLRSDPLRTAVWPLLCLGDPEGGRALCGRTGAKASDRSDVTAVHSACLTALWGPPRRPDTDPYNLILPRQSRR